MKTKSLVGNEIHFFSPSSSSSSSFVQLILLSLFVSFDVRTRVGMSNIDDSMPVPDFMCAGFGTNVTTLQR